MYLVKIFGKVVISGLDVDKHSLFRLLACIYQHYDLKARGRAIHYNIMPKFARFLGNMYINKICELSLLFQRIISLQWFTVQLGQASTFIFVKLLFD